MSNFSNKWSWGFKDKTGFDFLQLFLFPLLLAIGGYFFQYFQQGIADERYREEALQSYYKDMRELMLEKKLNVATSRDQVRSIARARTLSVLRRLDTQRRGLLTLFLKESDLIVLKTDDKRNLIKDKDGKLIDQIGIISMSGANLASADLRDMDLRQVSFWYARLMNSQLQGADLRKANLGKANLEGANLNGANLEGAHLDGANLKGANLDSANLEGAHLDGADLSQASMRGIKFCKTIMSDKTIKSDDNCKMKDDN
ncbi:pentapeptide repeat-containing protein [Leptolyngbyaceae cyanobacterium UHCC 1019]